MGCLRSGLPCLRRQGCGVIDASSLHSLLQPSMRRHSLEKGTILHSGLPVVAAYSELSLQLCGEPVGSGALVSSKARFCAHLRLLVGFEVPYQL